MTEESKTASPSNALGATQQGIISHLMATREAAATSASLGAAGLDRINLLHSLGGNNSEPLSLLLSQRNQLTDLISRSFSSSLAGERTLLARQLLAQQDEEALLVTLLRNRSHMQTDALLRSNHLLTNSAAALALAPSRVLQSVPRFLTEHGRPSASNRNMFLPSLPLERRDSPPLSSTTILDAFRRGQLTLDEAETLLRRLS